MAIKNHVSKKVVDVLATYAPQTGYNGDEKEKFLKNFTTLRIVYYLRQTESGLSDRIETTQMITEAIIDTQSATRGKTYLNHMVSFIYFLKKDGHLIIFNSGNIRSQVDY